MLLGVSGSGSGRPFMASIKRLNVYYTAVIDDEIVYIGEMRPIKTPISRRICIQFVANSGVERWKIAPTTATKTCT